ncbi:hypothetical protein Tco_0857627 [Tanacetum coccineum]|uniref:Uncharacterized protein n=1 Tax=Tanacetum coccineum TaxID=301880 RepID=A0ABQ5B756_9ASTR
MYLEHHEKQVEDILNYLDELYLYRIERMEGYHSYYVLSYVDRMPPKRTSTSETPSITLDALRQLITDFTVALEAQAATMANADNPNRNTRPSEPPVAKRGNYKEFINCQPFPTIQWQEGAVHEIEKTRWS